MTKTIVGAVVALMLNIPSTPARADPPSASTVAAQAAALASLPFADQEDFDFASRGFVATRTDPKIKRADGGVAWDLQAYDFVRGAPPATVNPGLWRQAQLLSKHGLFKVADRIWQVRGFDIANATFIQGDHGWIVIDTLTTAETGKAALDLVNQTLGARPVVAIIYTHSHSDHFGGARGMVGQAEVDAGKVKVIAPQGFLEEAVSENVLAGTAMGRRATYQFGYLLAPGPEGQISSGIGQAIAKGSMTLLPPNLTIDHTGETLTVDGVKLEFQLTPGTEAPAEMNIYLPGFHALCMAENANVSLHNVLTPRGALVRDSKAWAEDLTQSIRLFGARTDVMFTSHGWPRFGRAAVNRFLEDHRDAYEYLHDQSVRMMNEGLTGAEIGDRIALPPTLARDWFNQGFYGSMSFNARAVYQRYMGWYDANPVHLAPLEPADESARYVAAMGGAERVMELAKAAVDKGDLRWGATLLDRVVMADKADAKAREALAGVYTQLGYQSENALFRNMYLSGAEELREGVKTGGGPGVAIDLLRNTPSKMMFDLVGVRLNPEKVKDARLDVLLVFPERGERFHLRVRNDVLISEALTVGDPAPSGLDATFTLPRSALLPVLFAGAPLKPAIESGAVKVDGDATALDRLAGWLDTFRPNFPIVTR
jgi:alkyl sulfatase BDS1-like metallo-beta-lactamase superfamily hydrolase